PSESRGRRESRVPAAPAASRAMKKAHELVTTGTPQSSGLPCATVYDLWRALPGVHDLLVIVARAMRQAHCREFSTSQGVPGPHVFAVRENRRSSVGVFASIASRPAFVTTRPPLLPERDGG